MTTLQFVCGLEGWPEWKILTVRLQHKGRTLMSLEQTVKLMGARIEDVLKIMFVESGLFDLRSRATRSQQMLRIQCFVACYPNSDIHV